MGEGGTQDAGVPRVSVGLRTGLGKVCRASGPKWGDLLRGAEHTGSCPPQNSLSQASFEVSEVDIFYLGYHGHSDLSRSESRWFRWESGQRPQQAREHPWASGDGEGLLTTGQRPQRTVINPCQNDRVP